MLVRWVWLVGIDATMVRWRGVVVRNVWMRAFNEDCGWGCAQHSRDYAIMTALTSSVWDSHLKIRATPTPRCHTHSSWTHQSRCPCRQAGRAPTTSESRGAPWLAERPCAWTICGTAAETRSLWLWWWWQELWWQWGSGGDGDWFWWWLLLTSYVRWLSLWWR